MIGAPQTARENEILRTLEAVYPKGKRFTLIGGYAVDAYSPLPRYSVDCDMVIPKTELEALGGVLKELGYADNGAQWRDELSGLETRKFVKAVGAESVSVDMLIDGIRCRQTEAVWKEREVRGSSKVLRVVGVSRAVLSRVASRELLIAMKLHSGRGTDLRDVAMISESADWDLVAKWTGRGANDKVAAQLHRAVDEMTKPDFEGQLKAGFSSKKSEKRRIEATLNAINRIAKEMPIGPGTTGPSAK
jgi:hypothetical protein